MNNLASALPLPTQPGSAKLEYDHGLLRIREKTLVIGNSIFPIANIAAITLMDLRTPVPTFVWIILGVGVVCLLTVIAAMLGIPLIALGCYLLYMNWRSRSAADFALSIVTNSGKETVILNNDGKFLKAIALELYDVVELEKASNTTFNIDQKVMVDSITGSTVSISGIQGDIVHNVPAS